MKKGEFDLTVKAIDCSKLPELGNAGKEIFRALKIACSGFDNDFYGKFESISGRDYYLAIDLIDYKQIVINDTGAEYHKRKIIQPSDVLGQAAIDAAMDGATIVFEGDLIPDDLRDEYYPTTKKKNLASKGYKVEGRMEIIAYKLLDKKQPSIESKILAEKVGAKHDQGKPLYNLIPVHAEAELVDVLTFGATKYTPNQWRTVDNAKERYTAAAMRHLAAYRMGEESDPESGKHHLAHAMCCLSFIIELDLENQ